jgi:hypothetical protein
MSRLRTFRGTVAAILSLGIVLTVTAVQLYQGRAVREDKAARAALLAALRDGRRLPRGLALAPLGPGWDAEFVAELRSGPFEIIQETTTMDMLGGQLRDEHYSLWRRSPTHAVVRTAAGHCFSVYAPPPTGAVRVLSVHGQSC